jgi:hypothetical protein
MFTIDTESGFRDAILINASFGLGENVVQGSVNPDEYCVFKPTLKTGYRPILQSTWCQRWPLAIVPGSPSIAHHLRAAWIAMQGVLDAARCGVAGAAGRRSAPARNSRREDPES